MDGRRGRQPWLRWERICRGNLGVGSPDEAWGRLRSEGVKKVLTSRIRRLRCAIWTGTASRRMGGMSILGITNDKVYSVLIRRPELRAETTEVKVSNEQTIKMSIFKVIGVELDCLPPRPQKFQVKYPSL